MSKNKKEKTEEIRDQNIKNKIIEQELQHESYKDKNIVQKGVIFTKAKLNQVKNKASQAAGKVQNNVEKVDNYINDNKFTYWTRRILFSPALSLAISAALIFTGGVAAIAGVAALTLSLVKTVKNIFMQRKLNKVLIKSNKLKDIENNIAKSEELSKLASKHIGIEHAEFKKSLNLDKMRQATTTKADNKAKEPYLRFGYKMLNFLDFIPFVGSFINNTIPSMTHIKANFEAVKNLGKAGSKINSVKNVAKLFGNYTNLHDELVRNVRYSKFSNLNESQLNDLHNKSEKMSKFLTNLLTSNSTSKTNELVNIKNLVEQNNLQSKKSELSNQWKSYLDSKEAQIADELNYHVDANLKQSLVSILLDGKKMDYLHGKQVTDSNLKTLYDNIFKQELIQAIRNPKGNSATNSSIDKNLIKVKEVESEIDHIKHGNLSKIRSNSVVAGNKEQDLQPKRNSFAGRYKESKTNQQNRMGRG